MWEVEDLVKPDIVEVISQEVELRKTGVNFKGICPFHEEKTASFTVSPSRQTFKCFGCGEGGDVYDFIMKYKGVDFREASGGEYKPDPILQAKRLKVQRENYEKTQRLLLLGGFLAKVDKAKERYAKKEDWKMYQWLCHEETKWELEWSYLWEH